MGEAVAPSAGDGNGESRGPAAPAVNGLALPPTDDKVGGEIKADDSVDVGGGFGSVRLYRR